MKYGNTTYLIEINYYLGIELNYAYQYDATNIRSYMPISKTRYFLHSFWLGVAYIRHEKQLSFP